MALVLLDVRPQLVDQADAPALVAGGVHEHAAVLGRDPAHGQPQLHAAVAPQRAERVTGEALGVEADEDTVLVLHVAAHHGQVDVVGRALEGPHVEYTPRRGHGDTRHLSEHAALARRAVSPAHQRP